MTNSTKTFILSSFKDIEKSIEKNIAYIQHDASDAFRFHTANVENISAYSARLTECRGKREGIVFILNALGYDLVFNGEHLVDIKERNE